MNMLDNFEHILFCFYTSGVRRPLLALEPRIRFQIRSEFYRIRIGFLNLGHNKYEKKIEGF